MGPGVAFQLAQGCWSCCGDFIGCWLTSSLSCFCGYVSFGCWGFFYVCFWFLFVCLICFWFVWFGFWFCSCFFFLGGWCLVFFLLGGFAFFFSFPRQKTFVILVQRPQKSLKIYSTDCDTLSGSLCVAPKSRSIARCAIANLHTKLKVFVFSMFAKKGVLGVIPQS